MLLTKRDQCDRGNSVIFAWFGICDYARHCALLLGISCCASFERTQVGTSDWIQSFSDSMCVAANALSVVL